MTVREETVLLAIVINYTCTCKNSTIVATIQLTNYFALHVGPTFATATTTYSEDAGIIPVCVNGGDITMPVILQSINNSNATGTYNSM